jgi:hypothetical protein
MSQGARAKLRAHFLSNIGVVMSSDDLRQVAGGINEWARRVRELRTEEGYLILTEPRRVCRRQFGLSYAAMAGWSSMA